MQKFKRLEDLTITDDFMFSQVMKDEEICKEVVETILGIKVGRIKFLTSQHEIEITPEAKSITMDVYLRDEEKIINVEMQTGHKMNLRNDVVITKLLPISTTLSREISIRK